MKWEKRCLDEIADVNMGTSPSGETYNSDGKGLPLLNGPTEFGNTYPSCTLYTTDSKRECQEEDLIFCVRGSTTGRMNWADKIYSLGRGVCGIRGKNELATYYIRYCLENNLKGLLQLAGGGTFPNLKRGDIEGFQIPYSDNIETISAYLKNYDDLIENNLKRIKLLEESAQLLYRQWFVDFKFPGYENTKFSKGIPEGWKKKKISDLIELKYGKALKADDRKDGDTPVYGSSGIVGYHDKPLVNNSGIIVGRKGNVGSVFWSHEPFFPIDTVYYVATDMSHYYIYHALKDINFISSDSAVPGLNRNYAYSLPIIMPDSKVISIFDKVVKKTFKQLRNLERQNCSLKEAKEILLPRLMDGSIEV